ncbi:hypothetical protein F5Y10DRAFT_120715 [Nemania abortiva]|nr:hypothetical protein F5Y10DRAFT_120715 [Nemania abortiva]
MRDWGVNREPLHRSASFAVGIPCSSISVNPHMRVDMTHPANANKAALQGLTFRAPKLFLGCLVFVGLALLVFAYPPPTTIPPPACPLPPVLVEGRTQPSVIVDSVHMELGWLVYTVTVVSSLGRTALAVSIACGLSVIWTGSWYWVVVEARTTGVRTSAANAGDSFMIGVRGGLRFRSEFLVFVKDIIVRCAYDG